MTDDICGATTRDGDPCKLPAGWGTDSNGRCKLHGGNAGAPEGEANGSYDTGAFAEKIEADEIISAFEDAADADSLNPVWMRLAGEAFARYERSDDARHLAECRRCLENAGDDDTTVELGDIQLAADFTND